MPSLKSWGTTFYSADTLRETSIYKHFSPQFMRGTVKIKATTAIGHMPFLNCLKAMIIKREDRGLLVPRQNLPHSLPQ